MNRLIPVLTLLFFVSTTLGTGESFIPRANSLVSPSSKSEKKAESTGTSSSTLQPIYEAKTSSSLDKYKKLHKQSIENPTKFWGALAREVLTWDIPFDSDRVVQGDFLKGDVRWFEGGKLNVAYNALDRHDPESVAMIFEGDEPHDTQRITYGEMLAKVCQIANALKAQGVKKGDVVTIYMP